MNLSKTILTTIFLFWVFMSGLAQEFSIVGNFSVCLNECDDFFIETQQAVDSVKVWGIQSLGGNLVEIVTSEGPAFTICWGDIWFYTNLYTGVFFLNIEVFFSDGTVSTQEAVINNNTLGSPLYAIAGSCDDSDLNFYTYQICEGSTTVFGPLFEGYPYIFVAEYLYNVESYFVMDNLLVVNWGTGNYAELGILFEADTGYICNVHHYRVAAEFITPPEASFNTTPPTVDGVVQICEGQTVSFLNNSTNADSYEWMLGGTAAHSPSVEQAYQHAGTYEVSLIAYSDCLCNDTTSVIVEVLDTQSPLLDCVGTICAGETVTYTSDADCGTFIWEVSDNGMITDGGGTDENFITITWEEGTAGIIELLAENCNNFDGCNLPSIIEVPIISDVGQIRGPDKVCLGSTVQYALPNFTGVYFNWSTMGGLGDIVDGQGTNEVTVEWSQNTGLANQWIKVDYASCYLECGASAALMVDHLPDFLAFGDIEVCENESTRHQAVSTLNNVPTEVNWQVLDLDGNEHWNSQMPSTNLLLEWNFPPGEYTLVATPADPTAFCSEAYYIPVNVLGPTPAVDEILGDTLICLGSSYTYTAVSSQANTRMMWEINNGGDIITRSGSTVNVQWGASPPYEITISQVGTNEFACASTAFSQTIEPVSTLLITGPENSCVGEVASYTASIESASNYNWTIDPPGAGIITSNPAFSYIEVLWESVANASIQVEACGLTSELMVQTIALPDPEVIHPTRLCQNEEAVVEVVGTFSNYVWKNSSGDIISDQATTSLGPGYYSLIVEDEFGCIGETVFVILRASGVSTSISTPDPTVYCNALPSLTFYANDPPGEVGIQWIHNGNPVGDNALIFQANNFGSYQLQLTDADGCTSLSNTIQVVHDCSGNNLSDENCTGMESEFVIQSAAFCNTRAYLNQSADMLPGTVEWNFDDPSSGANNNSEVDNPTHVYSSAGFYNVVLAGHFNDPNQAGEVLYCATIITDTIAVAANFDYALTCPSEPVQFIDLSSTLPFTEVTEWSWDFNDPASGLANFSTASNPTHLFTGIGIYNVSLSVMTATGCEAIITREVEVTEANVISFDVSANTCVGSAISFVADAPDEVTTFQWDFGDPMSGSNNQSSASAAYHIFGEPGTYTISLATEDVYGCSGFSTQTINIGSNDQNGLITASPTGPVCEGDTVILSAPAGSVAWEWSTGETTNSIAVTETAFYFVSVQDVNGCSYITQPLGVDVFPAPESPIRVVTHNAYGQPIETFYDTYEACEGDDVFLETSENPDFIFEWSNGILGSETEFSEVRGNLLEVGTHDVFLTITDTTTNCSFEIGPYEITIHPAPDEVVITSDPEGLICENTTTTFSVQNPDPELTYLWNTGEWGTSIVASQAGNYYTTAISLFGCTTQSNHIQITNGPNIARVPTGCHTQCRPDTLCLPFIPGISSYQWFFEGEAIAPPDGTVPQLIATASGNYWLEMISSQGCKLTSGILTLDLFDGFGAIVGQVFLDVNGNEMIDDADSLLSGIDLQLLSEDGEGLGASTSDAEGAYAFANILSTKYQVVLDTNSLPEYHSVVTTQVETELIGCDVEETVNWLVIPECISVERELNFYPCSGESVEYAGTFFETDTSFSALYTTFDGCDSLEVVNIEIIEPQFSDLLLQVCEGASVEYQGVALQGGDAMDFVLTNQYGCDSTISVVVDIYPPILFETTAEKTCPGEASGRLSIDPFGASGYEYSLEPDVFQATPVFENLTEGAFLLQVRDENGCEQWVDVVIESYPTLTIQAEDAILDCELLQTEIEVEINGGDLATIAIVWEDGSTLPQRIVEGPGIYSVTVSDNCASIEQQIQVERDDLGLKDYFYFPNAFSPNDDGINDHFEVQLSAGVMLLEFELQVFDRWGNQVFASNEIGEKWRGQFRGKALSAGVYVWYLNSKVLVCGEEIKAERFGDISLVR